MRCGLFSPDSAPATGAHFGLGAFHLVHMYVYAPRGRGGEGSSLLYIFIAYYMQKKKKGGGSVKLLNGRPPSPCGIPGPATHMYDCSPN